MRGECNQEDPTQLTQKHSLGIFLYERIRVTCCSREVKFPQESDTTSNVQDICQSIDCLMRTRTLRPGKDGGELFQLRILARSKEPSTMIQRKSSTPTEFRMRCSHPTASLRGRRCSEMTTARFVTFASISLKTVLHVTACDTKVDHT